MSQCHCHLVHDNDIVYPVIFQGIKEIPGYDGESNPKEIGFGE